MGWEMSNNNDYKWYRSLSIASSIGLVLAVSIAIGYFFGSWLDKKFGTTPWLMLVFTLMGIAAGFIEMFKLAQQLSKDE
jgi:F0F1-type ATP synthase assembly protein I